MTEGVITSLSGKNLKRQHGDLTVPRERVPGIIQDMIDGKFHKEHVTRVTLWPERSAMIRIDYEFVELGVYDNE